MNTASTDSFIDYLYSLSQAGFAESLVLKARYRLLDYLGATLAGARMLQHRHISLLDKIGSEPGRASAIGLSRHTDMQSAALINGISAHAAELDDGERYGMVHPGAPVISALLPAAQALRLNSEDLFRGIIIGYEAAIRLARTLQPGMKMRGIHATGTCGTIGAAMGAAAALKLSKNETRSALAAAATCSSGLLAVIRGPSDLKPYNAGQAAQNGLVSAMVAGSGYQGPMQILEGDHGLLKILGHEAEAPCAWNKQGDLYAIDCVYVKPYAACRHCHAPIEGALKLRRENDIRSREIDTIRVITHKWAAHLHDHRDIQGVTSAKMSIPYSVAASFCTGDAGLNAFSQENISSPGILHLAQKVQVIVEEEMNSLVPKVRPARVEIFTRKGYLFSQQIDLPKGEPENPMTESEIKEKFIHLALYSGKSRRQAEQIIDTVFTPSTSLEQLFSQV